MHHSRWQGSNIQGLSTAGVAQVKTLTVLSLPGHLQRVEAGLAPLGSVLSVHLVDMC